MKKLLSILTISTLTSSVPAPLLANVPETRAKRDVSTLSYNSNNDYVPIKEINGISGQINSLAVDKKNNIYYSDYINNFVLKHGAIIPTKIDGIEDDARRILIDNSNNVFFGTNNGAYKLAAGADIATKINKLFWVSSLAVDNNNNIYIGVGGGLYKLSAGSDTPTTINGISDTINAIAVDSKDNIYFGTDSGAFVLKHGATIPIGGITTDSIQSIVVDKSDNVYIATAGNGLYKLSAGSDTPTPINGISGKIISSEIDSKKNIFYFIRDGVATGAFVLKHGATTPTPINGISGQINSLAVDSKDNIYFGTSKGTNILQTALSWTKQQSRFALVDSTKTKTWTRPDLLSVDGELNIDIADPNIDKVVFDNIQQGQTNKHWTINVKPETVPHDHNLQVTFTLEGKQYTSEITVSMQAKIEPPKSIVKENLSDVIKFDNNNDLDNIVDNNDDTIKAAITQKNARTVDFSQIEITAKTDTQATLTAKKDSKSYQGSVDVKYNVVPATVVDLKIDVIPTSSIATVIKDYLGQIDTSNLINPVNTFYYANSESVITMVKPTASSVITGIIYGCDERWNKTSQSNNIDPINGIKLDGSQLNTKEGKYVVELSDNLGHTNNVYLQIASKQKNWNYFDTDNGKQFEMWAKANGHDNIRGSSASQLNNLFAESKNWQQLASYSQFAAAIADWFKTSGKLLFKEPLTTKQVIEQLKTQIPNDIKIDGVNTNNYDVNKVSFVLNQSEFNPNDKVNIAVKYDSATSEQFTLQIKDSSTPDNKKGGDSKLWIIGVVVGVLAGVALAYLLFKRFVFDKYFLSKIKKRRHDKLVEKVRKEEAEKES